MKALTFILLTLVSLNAIGQTQLGDDILGESTGDNFGISTAMSSDGTVLAVGAILDDAVGSNSGHVRVFKYNVAKNKWNRLGFDIDGEASDDQSGRSVSLSSDGNMYVVNQIWTFRLKN
jgi:hypothetical protein